MIHMTQEDLEVRRFLRNRFQVASTDLAEAHGDVMRSKLYAPLDWQEGRTLKDRHLMLSRGCGPLSQSAVKLVGSAYITDFEC